MTVNPPRAAWRKSSYSGQSGDCIEVADGPPDTVGVRDSKNRDGPALLFTPGTWRTLLRRVKSGELA